MSDSLPNLQDTNMLLSLEHQYGTKKVVQYYLAKAHKAAGRARTALNTQNPYALGAEADAMIENIEMIYKFLGDDTRQLSSSESESPKK